MAAGRNIKTVGEKKKKTISAHLCVLYLYFIAVMKIMLNRSPSWIAIGCAVLALVGGAFYFSTRKQGPWVLGVTKRSSTPDVPQELREPEILAKPMEYLEDDVREELYKKRTQRVREYCKYMPNDTLLEQWAQNPGKSSIWNNLKYKFKILIIIYNK